MRVLVFFIFLFVFCTSCVKDKPQNGIQPAVQLTNNKKVYVINEGNYGSGNSSVSLFDPANGQIIEDFFKSQNNILLGDVTQSTCFFNSNFYIVVNNSGKVVVCNSLFKKTGQISGLLSPRYVLPITNKKAYISDLYANAISVVDLNINTKTGSIPCNGWTEQMVLIYNKAFVTNIKTNYVYVINTLEDKITDSIFVGKNASSLVLDNSDKLWVLSSGEKSSSVTGKLTKINTLNNAIELTLNFNINDSPNHLCLNKTKDTLYYLNGGVYRILVNNPVLQTNPLILKSNANFYGLGINPNDYNLYISDALDYISKSVIYIYDVNGNEKRHFNAGLISNGFYFE